MAILPTTPTPGLTDTTIEVLFKPLVGFLDSQSACTWKTPLGIIATGWTPVANNVNPFDSKGPRSNGGTGKLSAAKFGDASVPSGLYTLICLMVIGLFEGFRY